MKARDKVTILTYRKLRDKMGKAAIIEWQKLCLMLGFDPDPDVTVAIYASPEVEDPHANPRVDDRLGPVDPAVDPVEVEAAPFSLDPTPERPTTKPEKEKK